MNRIKLLSMTLAMTLAAPVAAAEPNPTELSCGNGSISLGFSPGIVMTSRDISVTGQGGFPSCTSSAEGSPPIVSGSFSYSGFGSFGCFGGTVTGDLTVDWNHGEQSIIRSTVSVGATNGGFSASGTGVIISGAYAGNSVALAFVFDNLEPTKCGFTGDGVPYAHAVAMINTF